MLELAKAQDFKRLDFFRNVFRLELQLYFNIVFLHYYDEDTIAIVIHVLISKLKGSWLMQSARNYTITREIESAIIKRDHAIIEKNKAMKNSKKRTPGFTRIRKTPFVPKPKRDKKMQLSREDRHTMRVLRKIDKDQEEGN